MKRAQLYQQLPENTNKKKSKKRKSSIYVMLFALRVRKNIKDFKAKNVSKFIYKYCNLVISIYLLSYSRDFIDDFYF